MLTRWAHNPKKLCNNLHFSVQSHSHVITRYRSSRNTPPRPPPSPSPPPSSTPSTPRASSAPISSSSSPSTADHSSPPPVTPSAPTPTPTSYTNTPTSHEENTVLDPPHPTDAPPLSTPYPPLYPPPNQPYPPFPFPPNQMPPNYTLPPSLALAFAFISASYPSQYPQYPPYAPFLPPSSPPPYFQETSHLPESSNPNLEAPNNTIPTNPWEPPPNLSNIAPEPPNLGLEQLNLGLEQPNLGLEQPNLGLEPPTLTTDSPRPPETDIEQQSHTPTEPSTKSQQSIYSGFLLKLCKQNDLEGVDKVLDTIQSKGIQLDASSYLSLFSYMCKIGDDVRIRNLQTAMASQRVPLDANAALALFAHHLSRGKIEGATYMIRKPPKGVTYTDKDGFDMLDTATRHVAPMECVNFFELIYKAGIPLSPAARNLVVEHCVAQRDWAATERILSYLLTIPHVSNTTFIVALRTLARAKQVNLVIKILDLMREKRPTHAAIYAGIMDALRDREHADVVNALTRDMRIKRIKLNKEVCEIAISSASAATNYQEVIAWYKTMKRMNFNRSPTTHKEVVEAYAHLGDTDKEFFEAIEERYSGLINVFHLFRANKNKHVSALVFRAICKHQLIPLPSIINFSLPILVEYAQKEITGEPRGSEHTEILLGSGWPEFLVEVLNICKKDKIALWPRVHTRVQEYVTWRTNYKPSSSNNTNNNNDEIKENNENSNNNEINNYDHQKESVQEEVREQKEEFRVDAKERTRELKERARGRETKERVRQKELQDTDPIRSVGETKMKY